MRAISCQSRQFARLNAAATRPSRVLAHDYILIHFNTNGKLSAWRFRPRPPEKPSQLLNTFT